MSSLPQMPSAEPNGFIKTLNNMGYMTSTIDPFSRSFVEFSSRARLPVLEIGAAYGIASLEALQGGATVIANDMDARHLEILSERADPAERSRLTLLPGAFPSGLTLPPESIDAALICRVMHFFTGPQIEESARVLHRWLARGGRAYVVAETPYLRNFSAFIPVYEERKKAADPWPGFLDHVKAIAPERGASLPDQMHFLDAEVLSRVFQRAGFRILRAETFARPEFPEDIQLDGRESVGMIAEKL